VTKQEALGSFLGKGKNIISFVNEPLPALEPTQPPIQLAQEDLFPRIRRQL
jgi:hypothetical protein